MSSFGEISKESDPTGGDHDEEEIVPASLRHFEPHQIYFESFDTPHLQERYSHVKKLGEGTFGEVYQVVDKVSNQFYALKYIRLRSQHKEKGLPKAIFREIEALRQCQPCPYIVQIGQVYGTEVSIAYVMEFMDLDLHSVVFQLRSTFGQHYLPRGVLRAFLYQMNEALHFLHSHRLIHRDIKPASKSPLRLVGVE